MDDKLALIQEIESLPPHIVNEVIIFIGYLKMRTKQAEDITLASEHVLAKDWLLPEEDAAWAGL